MVWGPCSNGYLVHLGSISGPARVQLGSISTRDQPEITIDDGASVIYKLEIKISKSLNSPLKTLHTRVYASFGLSAVVTPMRESLVTSVASCSSLHASVPKGRMGSTIYRKSAVESCTSIRVSLGNVVPNS